MPLGPLFGFRLETLPTGSEKTVKGDKLEDARFRRLALGSGVTYSDMRVFVPSAASQDCAAGHPSTPASPSPGQSRGVWCCSLITLQHAQRGPTERRCRPRRPCSRRRRRRGNVPVPALGERGPRLRRLGCESPPPRPSTRRRRRHRGREKGGGAAQPARALRGPEEVCWRGTKRAAAAGHASSL